jgi:hypothetical protein
MPPIPDFQKESIKIPDEAGLAIALLRDDLRNHRLKHIVPNNHIVKESPTDRWTLLPGIYVRKVANLGIINGEQLAENDDGTIDYGYIWMADLQFDLIAHAKTSFYYPPKEIFGELEENRYKHAKNCLPVIHWILHATLSENRKFSLPADPDFKWDTVEAGPFELVDGGYDGARDVWAIQALYRFQFEMVTRNELQGSS